MLRYAFNEETRKIYDSLSLSEDDHKDIAKIMDTMEIFAKGIVNETLERHSFNTRNQKDGEPFDDYITDLKTLSKNCNFCNDCHNGLIRDRIVGGITNNKLRKKLLAEHKLTLKKTEDLCRAHEKANEGAATIQHQREDDKEDIEPIYRGNKKPFNRQYNQQQTRSELPCKFCNTSHQRGRSFCPAWDRKCLSCGLKNHFKSSIVCKQRDNSNHVAASIEEKDLGALYLGAVNNSTNQNKPQQKTWEIEMPSVNGTIHFKIDTGADVTVISDTDLPKLGLSKANLRPTRKTLKGPSNQTLKCIGYIVTNFQWGEKSTRQVAYVCKGLTKALLGKPAINDLNIATQTEPNNYFCGEIDSDTPQAKHILAETSEIINKFPEVFQGLGKVKGEPVHIKMKENTTPYCLTAPRHIPIPMVKTVEQEITRMEQLGVIKKVDQPTKWCHPIVVVPKPSGEIRICIDLTKLNNGIEREIYQLESVEETIAKLGDECIFMSKLDANAGYWQIPLDEESQLLTTFVTPSGRYCCTRGPFGMNSMQEIFNKKMDIVIEGLQGVVKSTDDFLVFAKSREEHNQRLHALLNRFKEHGLTLNTAKCQFQKKNVDFLGYHLSQDGITPLTKKTEAITQFKQPENITELRRFIGMAQQVGKFSPKLAQASSPLRDLLSTKNDWLWTKTHTDAFNEVKRVLSSPQTLKLYDVQKTTKIRVDASKLNGISVILYQQHQDNWLPVTCASRYLTTEEKNYYPIELEMQAVTWGCEKMNMYLQGLPHFTIQTDHKPLYTDFKQQTLNRHVSSHTGDENETNEIFFHSRICERKRHVRC